MAKSTDKTKPKVTETVKKETVKRGRPSDKKSADKKEPAKSKEKLDKKKDTVITKDDGKLSANVGNPSDSLEVASPTPMPVVEQPELKSITPAIPVSPTAPIAPVTQEFDIYDGESRKEVLEIPVTEVQTQTQRIVALFSLDYARLPKNVVDAINDYLTDFRAFLANQSDVSKIPAIMQKDAIAEGLIRAWMEPKKSYFDKSLAEKAGSINVTIPENATPQVNPIEELQGKVIVGKDNFQSMVDKIPSVPSALALKDANQQPINNLPFHSQAGNQVVNTHTQHGFNPRTPTADYQHSVNINGVNSASIMGGTPLPPAFGDNRTEINRVMGELHQNGQTNFAPPVNVGINPNSDFLEKYVETIMQTINSTFQMLHWKYIPIDELQNLLKNTEKSLSYEIIKNGENTIIRVSNGQRKLDTPKFNCQ